MDAIKKWYKRRIDAGELSLSGWSRRFSQTIRWEANLDMINLMLGRCCKVSVVDFGCGTGEFYYWLKSKSRLEFYTGIEVRPEAFVVADEYRKINSDDFLLFNHIPSEFSRKVNAIVANAVYGFSQQNPFEDLVALKKVFSPDLIVVDLFSTLRPYEPEDQEGYYPYDPFSVVPRLCQLLKARKFAIDHARMPHAFTVGFGFTLTQWEKEEANGLSVHADAVRGRSC